MRSRILSDLSLDRTLITVEVMTDTTLSTRRGATDQRKLPGSKSTDFFGKTPSAECIRNTRTNNTHGQVPSRHRQFNRWVLKVCLPLCVHSLRHKRPPHRFFYFSVMWNKRNVSKITLVVLTTREV